MLKLTRKRGEGFKIGKEGFLLGDRIHIKVLGVENGIVTVGIDAPRDLSILRDEVIARIEKERRSKDVEDTAPQEANHATVDP